MLRRISGRNPAGILEKQKKNFGRISEESMEKSQDEILARIPVAMTGGTTEGIPGESSEGIL